MPETVKYWYEPQVTYRVVSDSRPLGARDTLFGITLGENVVAHHGLGVYSEFVKGRRRFEVGDLQPDQFLGPDVVVNVEGNFRPEEIIGRVIGGFVNAFSVIKPSKEIDGWIGVWRSYRKVPISCR